MAHWTHDSSRIFIFRTDKPSTAQAGARCRCFGGSFELSVNSINISDNVPTLLQSLQAAKGITDRLEELLE
jgi:hypothetical protein